MEDVQKRKLIVFFAQNEKYRVKQFDEFGHIKDPTSSHHLIYSSYFINCTFLRKQLTILTLKAFGL